MSEQNAVPNAQSKVAQYWQAAKERGLHVYGVIAAIIIVALAYFDAGEEPLRPIVQEIALPTAGAEG